MFNITGIAITDINNNTSEKIDKDQTLNTEVILETPTPIPKIFTKPNYFKYTVDIKGNKNNNNETLNTNQQERFLNPETGKNSSSNVTFYNIIKTVNTTTSQNQPITYKDNLNFEAQCRKEGLKYMCFQNKSSKITSEIEKTNSTIVFENKNISRKINSTDHENLSQTQFHNDSHLNNHETCGKFCKFRKVFQKVNDFKTRNKTIPTKSKTKKFNILKYLKHIFRNVFLKKTNKHKNFTINKMHRSRKRNLIRTICKNFESCKVDLRNKKLLTKIDQLRAESSKIIKSVRSIKGLLRLLDLEVDGKKLEYNLTSINNKSSITDVEKLNAILKDNYGIMYLGNLTETQNIQIAYVKQNTKTFMHSLENFAQILNEIVRIFTDCQLNYYTKVLNRFTRNSENQATLKIALNKSDTIEEKLDKIKKLLINYNLVQNQFMKRMYDVMVTLRPNTTNNNTEDKESYLKESILNKNDNDTSVIENYTKNIITNLRKLKNLAQRFSFKNRRKREVMENDDIVEYLLILMEYLLKQKKQLTITPGIFY